MKTYRLNDGGTIQADDASQFVTRLRQGSKFDFDLTDAVYMARYAHRELISSGTVLRSDSSTHFLDDLLSNSLVYVL